MRIVVIISTLLIFNSNILAQDHSPFLREGPIGRPVCDVGERDPYPVVCWDGEAVVFLPAERGSVSRREDLEFARRAGSIADIVSVEVRDGRYRIVLRDRADGRELSRNVGSDDTTLRGTALVRDIEAARELYLGDTLHVRRTSLNTYDPSVHRLRSFEVEFDARVSIQDIVVGWDTDRPLRVVVQTEDGQEGFVDVAWRLKNGWSDAVDPDRFEGIFRQNAIVVHQVEYCMQRGDDLSDVAREYDVPTSEIKRWNNLQQDRISDGQVLLVYVTDDEVYEVSIIYEPRVLAFVDQMPELIGGIAAVEHSIRYPEVARRSRVEGIVYVQFIVNEHGRVISPHVRHSRGAGLDEEAVRVISRARFVPGRHRGEPVHVRMTLPITFRLP